MQKELYFNEAAKEAKKSLCDKAKCGAIVVLDSEVVGRGYNAPPLDEPENKKCNSKYGRDLKKPKSDRTCCMHAEWRAIIDGLKNKGDISGSHMYFTRINNDGMIVKSGDPYCTVCSRLALDTGVKKFYLWHEKGIKGYDTKEYNDLSYAFHLS